MPSRAKGAGDGAAGVLAGADDQTGLFVHHGKLLTASVWLLFKTKYHIGTELQPNTESLPATGTGMACPHT